MQIIFNGNESFADAAQKYTIGGDAYGVALANLARASGEFVYPPKGFVLNVPDSWIKPSWLSATYDASAPVPLEVVIAGGTAQTPATRPGIPWYAWVAIGFAALFVLTDAKSKRKTR